MFSVAWLHTALYIFLCFISISKVEPCGYTVPKMSEVVTGIKIDPLPSGVSPRSSNANNLRIYYDYMYSFNNYGGATDLKRDVLEPARLSLQSMITVNNPISGILRVDRQCENVTYINPITKNSWCNGDCAATTTCLGIVIPNKYLKKCRRGNANNVTVSGSDGAGENNVDIVIVVSYGLCQTDYARQVAASSCFLEGTLDRPILGILHFCSGMITAGINIRENTMAIKHQIVHVLGFAVDKYAFYRNQYGTPITPRDNLGLPSGGLNIFGFYKFSEKMITVSTRDRSSVSKKYTRDFISLLLPNVVAVAREHFNCPSINSVDLEDNGTVSSAASHFDEYLLYNECMTSENNGWNDRLSKFTLALLKDTGWYGVDYSKADDLLYGKNAGCIMPLKGCYAYMESQRTQLDPFCNTVSGQILQCNPTRQYYEYCNIKQYSSLGSEYQYFKSLKGLVNYDPSTYAGHSEFSEYCPIKVVLNTSSGGPSSDCTDASNNGKSNIFTPIQSGYGSNSMCFDTSLSYYQSTYGASCLNYSYQAYNDVYKVCAGGRIHTCRANFIGEFFSLNSVHSTLTCPQPSSLTTNNYYEFICLGNRLHQWSLIIAVISLATTLFAQ